MKKNSFKKILLTASLCLFAGIFLLAQEEDEEKQDSLKKIREDEIVDVKKIKIEITIDYDGECHAIIHKHGGGEHMKWIDSGSGKHFVIVEEEDGKKKRSEVIIDIHKNDKGNVFIREKEIDDKKIIVLESSGKPIHFTTKDGKELEFIVKDNKTGTNIVIDKVSVIRIETTEDGDIKIIISDKKEKAVKKESKQKKK